MLSPAVPATFLPSLNPTMLSPSELFKCLADETRIRCLVLLRKEGKLCVCELTEALGLLQPKISRHLAKLRGANLLLDSREGQWVYYQLNPNLPDWVLLVLDTLVAQTSADSQHQQDCSRLQAIAGRPAASNQCCN